MDDYDPVSRAEMNVFGEGAKAHPVTGMALETGIGSLPEKQQAYLHLNVIHHHHGKDAADEMRGKVDAYYTVAKDVAAAKVLHIPLPPKE